MRFGTAMNEYHRNGAAITLLLAAMTPMIAVAQTAATAPQDTGRTIPGLVVPTPTPVPVPTSPVLGFPAATSTIAPPAGAPVHVPRHRPDRTRVSTPTPVPTSTPAVQPTPLATATPAVLPAATATPVPTATPAPAMQVAVPKDSTPWAWLVAGVALLLLVLGGWAWRRRSASPPFVAPAPGRSAPQPALPLLAPIDAPMPSTRPRAIVAITLRPVRAGLNMLSALVEGEVVVANGGDATAEQVRIHATLLSAHAGQDGDLAAIFAAPLLGRPAMPTFTLAPGEERRVRIVAALPQAAVRSMEAAGRPMFVPLVAIDVRYASDADGTPGRTGQAYMIGVERVDSAKLAPFWLDGPLRMYDQIAARAQGAVVLD